MQPTATITINSSRVKSRQDLPPSGTVDYVFFLFFLFDLESLVDNIKNCGSSCWKKCLTD
jgi:hypothetical protein